jgi:hypothetical protein
MDKSLFASFSSEKEDSSSSLPTKLSRCNHCLNATKCSGKTAG